MTELTFTNYVKSYVDNHIDIPEYINEYVKSNNLNPVKIYEIGLDYLRRGLVHYAKPILKTVGVSLNNA